MDPQTPDQTALLYRKGHLTGIPATPGGPTPEITEVLHLHQYGNTIVSTLPHVDLGNGTLSKGTVRTVTYISEYVATANFRVMIITHTQPGTDGWTTADPTTYTGDPTTLTPATRQPIGTP